MTQLSLFPNLMKIVTGMLATMAILMNSAVAEKLNVEYIRPNVDFTRYNQFIIDPLDLSDTKVVPPIWVENPKSHDWKLTEENRTYIENLYMKTMVEAIQANKALNVVQNPTPNTLELRVNIVSFTPWVSRGEKAETRGSGKMEVEVQLRDAHNGNLLAIFEGSQSIGKDFQENTRFNHEHNLQEHFKQWGQNIGKALASIPSK